MNKDEPINEVAEAFFAAGRARNAAIEQFREDLAVEQKLLKTIHVPLDTWIAQTRARLDEDYAAFSKYLTDLQDDLKESEKPDEWLAERLSWIDRVLARPISALQLPVTQVHATGHVNNPTGAPLQSSGAPMVTEPSPTVNDFVLRFQRPAAFPTGE